MWIERKYTLKGKKMDIKYIKRRRKQKNSGPIRSHPAQRIEEQINAIDRTPF